MHIHEFDQYFYVLEGTLDVEVALQKRRVEAGMLVVLPAGVPHRQYNTGDTAERHIAINTPGPEAGRPWDYGVDFCANGHDLSWHHSEKGLTAGVATTFPMPR